jgi:N-acetylgalactosamine-N,N'-diacetylbacillosaminyl-diphospho-undecaprenol 4-alpha-N-acetylgalactosaminyltransferase
MSAGRKKVLLIIPNLDFGGAQNAFARLSEIISPHCDLLLVVFNKNNLAPLTLYAPLVELKVQGARFYTGKIIAFVKRIRILGKIKRNFKPDLSISFLEGADYVNLLSSSGERIFFYLHGSKYFDRNITGFLGFIRKRFLIPFFYSRADKILVVNDRLRFELMEHFGVTEVPYQAMPNFYDTKELNSLASEPVHGFLQTMFDNHPTLCISGRIAPEKGIDKFVTILPEILKSTPGLKVVIVGDGVFKETVIAACQKVNIQFAEFIDGLCGSANFTVLFVGYQKNPYRFLKRSSIVILPSLNEGMPNTIVEALCLGVPVVAADCPYGPRELLSKTKKDQQQWPEFSDYGILVPVLGQNADGESAWTEAIVKMIEDTSLRQHYATMGSKRSLDFSKERSIQSWLKLLNEA